MMARSAVVACSRRGGAPHGPRHGRDRVQLARVVARHELADIHLPAARGARLLLRKLHRPQHLVAKLFDHLRVRAPALHGTHVLGRALEQHGLAKAAVAVLQWLVIHSPQHWGAQALIEIKKIEIYVI